MRYSKGRIRYLAKKMMELYKKEGVFDVISNESLVINNIIDTIEGYFEAEDEVYEKVMKNLQNRTKKLVPGSMEWEIAFNKAYEEEMSKRLMK